MPDGRIALRDRARLRSSSRVGLDSDAGPRLQRQPDIPKRRVIGNPWSKRGTMFRSAVDVMRRAGVPMTAREITDAVLADKDPQPTRKQAIDVQAAILAALRKRDVLHRQMQ